MDDFLLLQGVGGPLNSFGVEHFVAQIERRGETLGQGAGSSPTRSWSLFWNSRPDLMYDKVQPYKDRK